MQSAPAVTYPVVRSNLEVRLSWTLLCISAGVFLPIWTVMGVTDGRLALHAGVWLVCAVVVVHRARYTPNGELRWNGQTWQFLIDEQVVEGQAVPQLDWQSGILLEFRARERGLQWLWLACGDAPPHWNALRRALWASRSSGDRLPGPTSGIV